MGGNNKLYQKMLCRFYETQKDFVVSFEVAWASGDAGQATMSAHTLKGLAGTIGAQRLQQAAAALESTCGDWLKQDIHDRLRAVTEELDTVLGGLARLVGGTDAEPVKKPEEQSVLPELSVAMIYDLRAAVSDLDKGRLLLLLDHLQESAPDFVARLRALAESYRFDLIEKILSGTTESDGGLT
jgi:HPt (histidine-containing phosphotransfer) domain-containing protein